MEYLALLHEEEGVKSKLTDEVIKKMSDLGQSLSSFDGTYSQKNGIGSRFEQNKMVLFTGNPQNENVTGHIQFIQYTSNNAPIPGLGNRIAPSSIINELSFPIIIDDEIIVDFENPEEKSSFKRFEVTHFFIQKSSIIKSILLPKRYENIRSKISPTELTPHNGIYTSSYITRNNLILILKELEIFNNFFTT